MSTTEARGQVHAEVGAKRVRAFLGGQVIADTTRPVLVWEVPYYPAYYFPVKDVRVALEPDGGVDRSPSRGAGRTYAITVGDRRVEDAAVRYEDSPLEELRDLVKLRWDAMDAWFEEDEEVFVHPRDPHTRVDILPSSRHVRVEVYPTPVPESERIAGLVSFYDEKVDTYVDGVLQEQPRTKFS